VPGVPVLANDISDSSSDEEMMIESSWQKTTLKGSNFDSSPEKLGEDVAGLHNIILLIPKILRGIQKKKKTSTANSK
jgi:hypothetical protein